MARNEQLIRQHKILQILEKYRFGRLLDEIRDELVDEMGLSSLHARTVRRDLEALQAAGIDINVQEIQRGKVWKLGPRSKGAHKVTVSATELIALSLSRDLMHPLAGTPFWQGIETFWNTLQDQLPDSVWDHYDKYREVLRVLGTPAKSYAKQHGILKTINRGILEHRVIEVEYQKLGQSFTSRRIEPYAVMFYQSSLYILAADNHRPNDEDRIRRFKLDRFRKATILDEWFTPLAEGELEQHLGQSLGIFSGDKPRNFKIRISAYAAPWVREDPWHPDQKITERKDGSIDLLVQAAHDLEIIPRVLTFGREAELVSPKSCRVSIANMIEEMASRYDDVK